MMRRHSGTVVSATEVRPTLVAQMDEISRALFRIASLDFSEPLVPRMDGTTADGVMAAINMLAEEFQAQLAERDRASATLEERVRERTKDLEASQRQAEQARERAVAASEVKSRFLANMSHEIRTPMSNVLGMTALALDEGLSGRAREYVAAAHSAAQSLLIIVNDILDISKIEAGRLTIACAPFSPRQEVEASLVPRLIRAREKNLATDVDIDAAVPAMILGDAVRFRQVLVNVFFNAIKFTEKGSVTVRVFMDDDGDRIHVVVTDTGIGVGPAEAQKMFEPFRQANESISRSFGGTGLGLAICRELTSMMGGAIWHEDAPGGGSTFHFTVQAPRAPTSTAMLAAAPHRGPDVDARRLRVLVAEDNPVSAKLVIRMLEKASCDTVHVTCGRTAVESAIGRDFDLILMDMQMPGMDGLEATVRIRRNDEASGLPRVPIWALTANAMSGDDLLCLRAGMDGHIAKPIDRTVLSRMLDTIRGEARST